MYDVEGLAAVEREGYLTGSAVVGGAAGDGHFVGLAWGVGRYGGGLGGAEEGEVAFAGEVGAGAGQGGCHAVIWAGGVFVCFGSEGGWVGQFHVGC